LKFQWNLLGGDFESTKNSSIRRNKQRQHPILLDTGWDENQLETEMKSHSWIIT
jgi:putative transcriptional regulator